MAGSWVVVRVENVLKINGLITTSTVINLSAITPMKISSLKIIVILLMVIVCLYLISVCA